MKRLVGVALTCLPITVMAQVAVIIEHPIIEHPIIEYGAGSASPAAKTGRAYAGATRGSNTTINISSRGDVQAWSGDGQPLVQQSSNRGRQTSSRGRQTSSIPPGVPQGAINTQSGQYYPPAGGGAINPHTGEFYPDVGAGYINPQTGQFMPKIP